jgi:hypothetical protein
LTAKYDLPINEGETFVLPIQRQAPRLDVNGNPVLINGVLQYDPVNMLGWAGHMQVRRDFDSSVAVIDITEDVAGADGHLVFGNGEFAITILAPKTFVIQQGMVYDLFGTPPGGEPEKILHGMINKERAVTR